MECIDAIEAALTPEEARGFRKGNAMKYIWRAGKKGDDNYEQDLAKADWYLERERRRAAEERDNPGPEDPTIDIIESLLYEAWAIIANANADDWNTRQGETESDWLVAAKRWRDRFHENLDISEPASVGSHDESNPDRPHHQPAPVGDPRHDQLARDTRQQRGFLS